MPNHALDRAEVWSQVPKKFVLWDSEHYSWIADARMADK